MKKVLALVLMLCLLCGGAAMAEDLEQLLAMSWDEIAPNLPDMGIDGGYDTLDMLGLQLYIPSTLSKVEVSAEDAAAGRLACYASSDGTGYLVVDAVNMADMTIDQWYEALNATETMSDVRMDSINGLGVVIYKNNTTDLWVCSLVDTNSNVITFAMGPASEEGSELVFNLLMKSLKPAE